MRFLPSRLIRAPLVTFAGRLLAVGLLCLAAGSAAAADPLLGGTPGYLPSFGMSANTPGQLPAADAAAPPADLQVRPPQTLDYSANLQSDVFGARLFTGAFARQGATQFNPDYVIAVGDRLQVRLWGAFNFDSQLLVDAKGNIFLPNIGPVPVLGVRNQDLQSHVEKAVGKVFRSNVFSYASLAAAQPVRVFVGGFVSRPGLYNGTSMDSLLHFLDQAGGIDPERGSFLNVQVKRSGQLRAHINLYDFLLDGRIALTQLADGDVIFVGSRQSTVKVNGLAENPNRFEFAGPGQSMAELARLAKSGPQATHVRVMRNTGTTRNVEYYPLSEAPGVLLQNGDEIEFTADKMPGTITVRVEGEHRSGQEYVLPYGTRLGTLLAQVQFSERSDARSLQLFRLSVKERQKQLIQTSLHSLEAAALTARSGTSDEARLRKDESELILQWIERARKIEPSGQVILAQGRAEEDLLLENGDLVRVPRKDGLVLVSGEVLFPNAIAFDSTLGLEDYVRRAGGYTQNAEASRVVIAHRDGSFDESQEARSFLGLGTAGHAARIRPGDEVLVLPKIDVKSRQIAKDMSQVLFQIALAAKVVLGL